MESSPAAGCCSGETRQSEEVRAVSLSAGPADVPRSAQGGGRLAPAAAPASSERCAGRLTAVKGTGTRPLRFRRPLAGAVERTLSTRSCF